MEEKIFSKNNDMTLDGAIMHMDAVGEAENLSTL